MKPVISIICNTYNHEKYIAQALDSFLMQKVDVPFEILVHDDASTDSTADIIRQYVEKYPDIIKPIFQTENQFSKRVMITWEIQLPRVQGEYIAFCEGDDYWTDENKLQKQYDFLSRHDEYSACFHGYKTVDKDGNDLEHKRCRTQDGDMVLTDFIGNQLDVPQYATIFYKKEIVSGFDGMFLGERCSDIFFRIYCTLYGKVYYFDEEMSAYRRFTEGSWTENTAKNPKKFAESLRRYEKFFLKLDELTGAKYHDAIFDAIDQRLFQADLIENKFRAAKSRAAFKTASLKRRIYITIGCIFPRLIIFLRK